MLVLFLSVAAHSGALCLVCLAAFGATGRLMLETLFGIELLLTRGENKLFAAIPASQRLVGHIIKLLLVFNFQNMTGNKRNHSLGRQILKLVKI